MSSYTPVLIGNASPSGGQVPAGNGYDISGGGSGITGSADQCRFSYQLRTGDFDVKVRVVSLELADAWSQAGLMAREDLTAGSRSASVLATPTISGAFFESRSATNGTAALSGSFPVNFPHTWLRLKRAGNTLTGYAGFDGLNWSQLGSVTMTLPADLNLGFVVSSYNTNQLATAAFRDFSPVSLVGTNPMPLIEPLGQCSRRTSLVISEIMYHPAQSNLAFVEIFNSRGEPQDLGGYRLGGNIDYTFPVGTWLPGGGFVVVAKSPADLQNAYGISGVFGPYTNNLPNGNGTVRLLNQSGAIFLEVNYSDQPPWPVSADGAGHSLVLARSSYGEDNPQAWAASDAIGGSPGRTDPYTVGPLRNVVINEFLAHTDDPEVDYIELYNHSTDPVDISGCILTDDAATNKLVIAQGTSIPARGFVYFTQTNMNFSLSADGETIYLKNPGRTRILDAVRFGGQQNGVAAGRVPDGGSQFYRLQSKTPGKPNGAALVSDIVINEIMYSPISLDDDDQYVELYNRSTSAVDLSGWKFVSGINFTFPPGALIAPDGYMVVARNSARMLTNYPNLNAANLVGDFGGKLSHRGERAALAMPDTIVSTNSSGVVVTNKIEIVVDEVTYQVGGRWPQWAAGGGSSLELIDPHADHRQAANWADSDETHKAPWTQIWATGTIDNGRTSSILADQLQVLLQGAGECLIDNVQVIDSSGNNRIANSAFETDASGWTAEGTESPSGLETTEGYQSARSYHVRAIDRGDNQVNRIRTPLTSSLPIGMQNVTIKAAVRWLRGHPEILLRLRGNWLECVGELALPARPGTPGARNSCYAANAAPAIFEVRHDPLLPQASKPIVVTAQASDPDGLGSFTLKYRLDPSTSYVSVPMNDSGTNGDAVAGDGVFSATIPGQPAGTLVAFYLQASDLAAAPASATFPKDAPTRECLVRIGEVQPVGNFPVYRVWMTQSTFNAWSGRNKLDNTPNDVTFVLGGSRVVYNTEALYAGSPHIAPGYCGPTCGRCAYTVTFPADDLFLGERNLVLDWPGGHGNETSAMQEEMAYWIADRIGLPFSHRYIIRLHVNGVTDDARSAVFEAVWQPGGSFVNAWSPQDSSGQFFKIDQCFEFNDSGGNMTAPGPLLQNFTTTGGAKKREAYRWNFNYRAGDRFNDYTNLFSLVDAVNATRPEPYTAATEALVDVEEWMGIFATEHIIVNFDAYGHTIGKNMYAYLPSHGKWQLYMFDLDWLMLAAVNFNASYGPSTAPMFNAEDPTITTMYAHPPFLRAYWRAVERAVNGPLDAAQCNPLMDAKYRSLVANGVAWCDGQRLTDPTSVKTWFSQRRAALQAQLAAVAAPLSIGSVQVSNNIAQISGTAPIAAQTLWFNGGDYPLTWTSVSNWTARVPLQPGNNSLSVVGVDWQGQPLPGVSTTVAAAYNGAASSPVGQVVINEIMYNPLVPDGQYVELYNNSSALSYDLSGWQFHGLSYTFPAGALLGPGQFLVLAANRSAFAATYGATNLVFDTFGGTLQADGETLSLVFPGTNAASDQIVSRVRYGAAPPWPTEPGGTGSALQLVDPRQDNWRLGNWAAASTNKPGSLPPQWVQVVATGVASSSRLDIYLQSSGIVYLDDVQLVAGSTPGAGQNLVANGDFETPLAASWSAGPDFSLSGLNTVNKHTGSTGLELVSTGVGNTSGNALFQDINPPLATGQTYTLSCWYLQSTNLNSPNLVIELSGSGVSSGTIKTVVPGLGPVLMAATPGAINSVNAALPSFPPLWINELQVDNLTGITNRGGTRTPWLELYNPSTNAVSLSGLYLANSYSNLAAWAFPADAGINPGQFLVVFADGLTALSSANELHTSFALTSGSGSVLLSRIYNNQPQVLDYLDYQNLTPNRSFGSFPDGQSFTRQEFFYVSPAATNNGTSGPLSVRINEIMAGNTHTLANPVSGKFSDWFELYNYGATTANLGGYYLSDELTNQLKFQIPAGYAIPPGGFLLVWADGKDTNGTPDLHISFKLNKGGESLGLFGSDGVAVDYLTYGPQLDDVSLGRFPDGSGPLYLMPQATPRTNNVIPNTPPTISPIPDRSLTLGQTLTFSVSAADSDLPPQSLTFGLAAEAPANATINPLTGLFSWTPQTAPSTNSITVIVTDNGTPALSTSAGFTVWVLLPPQMSSVVANGSQFTLSWLSVSGQIYQLEFSDDLAAAAWSAVGGPVAGTGQELTLTLDLGAANQRFYRLRLMP
ncbi:MAG TPA: lamin tail domain-containing protein [Verrucomicrobiae bacterium]